ncbi:MAG TPA: SIS domain-containing protein, partial [Candidatus Pullichristensenella excrementigallinarum]|nr:SIS domain-containing protein [Candidatus Pullichristensenella excrementigallinarum]
MTNEIKLTTARDIAAAVDQIAKKLEDKGGLKTVFCVACGGSLSSTYPLYYLLRQEAKSIHAELIPSNEFCYATPAALGENSLVLLMSRAGTTPETVDAVRHAKAKGATVITMSISEDVPLAQGSDYHFLWAATNQDDYKYSNTAIVLQIGFEILRRCENYAHYDAAVKAFDALDSIIRAAIEKVAPRAEKWADRYQNDQTIYTIS